MEQYGYVGTSKGMNSPARSSMGSATARRTEKPRKKSQNIKQQL